MGKFFELSEVFPVIYKIIRQVHPNQAFLTHQEIAETLLREEGDLGLVDDAYERAKALGVNHDQMWLASNMVAWFSQKFTEGKTGYEDQFERRKDGEFWSYRPKSLVSVQLDEKTSQQYLQGVEVAGVDYANVYGDEDYNPLETSKTCELCFEVEVKYCFFEGNTDDWAEVHAFRAWVWRKIDGKALRDTMYLDDWEDFCAYHEDSCGEWAAMLRVATQRIRDVRHNKISFKPRIVGKPSAE